VEPRRWVPVLIVLLGCGTVRSMMSEVKDAKLTCAKCQAGMAVAVGAPLKLDLTWKKCSSLDQHCHPDVPPFKVAVRCDGVECGVEDTGGGYYEVTPTTAGEASIVVTLEDQQKREDRIGPFTALALDGIQMACTFIPPGGGLDQRAPCSDRVPPASDIYVEIIALAGERRLANPLPRDVAVNGRLIYAEGQMTGNADWECKPSIDSSDPTVPTVTKCHAASVRPGTTWSLEARLPDQHLAARLPIAVSKK